MEIYTCLEGSKRKLKAYTADYWGRIQQVYNVADTDCKKDVKKEVIVLLDRLKVLLEREAK